MEIINKIRPNPFPTRMQSISLKLATLLLSLPCTLYMWIYRLLIDEAT
jgi:hypothetical protein